MIRSYVLCGVARRLLIITCTPLGFLFAASAWQIGWLLKEQRLCMPWGGVIVEDILAAVRVGLRRTVPLTSVVVFLVAPGLSTRIFKTFSCENIEYDAANNVTRRYMLHDLATPCDSGEYDMTRIAAFLMLAIWPVGVPILYAALLWANRDAVVSRSLTPGSRATKFLWADYKPELFW